MLFSFLVTTFLALTLNLQVGFNKVELKVIPAFGQPLVTEIVIKCPAHMKAAGNFGIVSYSSVEKLYCTPLSSCFLTLENAIKETCS